MNLEQSTVSDSHNIGDSTSFMPVVTIGDRLQEVLDFCLANRYEVNVRSVTTPSM